jgi:hypothetical protein
VLQRIAASDSFFSLRCSPTARGWYPLVSARGDHRWRGLPEPRRGTLALLDSRRHRRRAGDAVYPARTRLKAMRFRYFPQWERILPHIDPRFSSGFWRRVMET